jgi:hypothetical protein
VTRGADFWIKTFVSCTNRQLVTNPSTSLGHGRLLLGVAMLGAVTGACGKHGNQGDLTSLDGGPINGEPWADDLLSDFEDTTAAIVLRLGWPPRNGFWYTYNDASRTCTQTPKPAAQAVAAGAKPATYIGAPPPTASSGPSGGRALRAQWKGCSTTGAGIAADFNAGMNLDGTLYTGPKVAYDIHSWTGVTFWAMATAGSDVNLRVNLPMLATLRLADGGNCDEADAGVGKCGDHWGAPVTLSANGKWTQISMRISDASFRQQGSGAAIPWDPTQVTGVQIQSADVGQTYDFWIDDVYLLR